MKLEADVLKSLLSNVSNDSTKQNFFCECPWCGEREFGISITLENHPFNCFRKTKCGESGTIFKFLKKINRLDILKYGFDEVNFDQLKLIEEGSEELTLELPTITPPIGFRRIFKHPYLEKRNFSNFNKYTIGVTSIDPKLDNNYIIILVFENNELKGYLGRKALSKKAIDKYNKVNPDNKIIRYRNSQETDFAKLLLGYDELVENETHTVILVEGFFDKDNLDKLLELDDSNEIKCCCSFGAKLSIEQIVKLHLKGVKNLIIFFDGDVVDKIKKIGNNYLDEFETVKVAFHPNKDPGELNFEECVNVFENLEDAFEFSLSKVKILSL
jgi:5S rRNA maturation endonuclease (ribonuclease M5)